LTDNDQSANSGTIYDKSGIAIVNANARIDKLENQAREAERRDENYKQRQLETNRKLMWFTGILAFCGIVGGGISIWQIHVANITAIAAQDNASAAESNAESAKQQLAKLGESNQINREALESVQRAYISFFHIDSARVLRPGKTGHFYEFTPSMQNNGNTQATIIASAIGGKTERQPTEKQFLAAQVDRFPIPLGSKSTQPVGPYVLPESEVFGNDLGDDLRPLGPLFMLSKITIKKHAVVWFWVVYKDVFPDTKPHLTVTCPPLSIT